MRREYTSYESNIDINFSLAKIKNYPLSWGDSIRMFFVLEGSIIVGLENEEFKLEEDSIEIINKNEPYYIKTENQDNLVLIIDINPEFFTKFNDFAEYIHYYTDTFDGSRQKEYKYTKLREYISMLFYEFIEQEDGYEENMEDVLLKTMNHLLNNFHYLFYEEESLKEDGIQLERFTRIIYYIKQNYKEKVSLTEIAEREFLTPQYLSYKIKDTFGQSFNDFLNKIRVEESRKLLLDTDKSISEIALETGFSHSRYYNKHFLRIHGINPAEYREKYRVSDEELEKQRQIEYLDIETAMPYLENYLHKYIRYTQNEIIDKKKIDLDEEVIGYLNTEIILDINEVNLFDIRNINFLRELIQDLNIEYLYCEKVGELESILSYVEMEKIDVLTSKEIESDDYVFLDIGPNNKKNLVNFYENLSKRKHLIIKFKDRDEDENGLLTRDYLKKPLYFNIKFFSKMGEEVLYKDDNTVVTQSKLGYEVLAYSSDKEPFKMSINLHGLKKKYRYILYKHDKNTDIFNKLKKIGNPKVLDKIFLEELKKVDVRGEFGIIEKASIQNFILELDTNNSTLIVLR